MKDTEDSSHSSGESKVASVVANHGRSHRPKVIITGTGRAGTTFLVQLLTELRLDTGYTPASWRRDYDDHCAAGLEHDLADENSPRIVKNPSLCKTLPGLLKQGGIVVEHAIIPVRSLDEAARSRIWIGGQGNTPGGLTGTGIAEGQKAVLAENFHCLMHTLAEHDIPHTFLVFPRFVRDASYTWRKLRWLLVGIDHETFVAAFERTARPELIHVFTAGVPADAGVRALHYGSQQRKKRFRRRVRRALVWSVLLSAFWACWLQSGRAAKDKGNADLDRIKPDRSAHGRQVDLGAVKPNSAPIVTP
jgi:hypothetical protein